MQGLWDELLTVAKASSDMLLDKDLCLYLVLGGIGRYKYHTFVFLQSLVSESTFSRSSGSKKREFEKEDLAQQPQNFF